MMPISDERGCGTGCTILTLASSIDLCELRAHAELARRVGVGHLALASLARGCMWPCGLTEATCVLLCWTLAGADVVEVVGDQSRGGSCRPVETCGPVVAVETKHVYVFSIRVCPDGPGTHHVYARASVHIYTQYTYGRKGIKLLLLDSSNLCKTAKLVAYTYMSCRSSREYVYMHAVISCRSSTRSWC